MPALQLTKREWLESNLTNAVNSFFCMFAPDMGNRTYKTVKMTVSIAALMAALLTFSYASGQKRNLTKAQRDSIQAVRDSILDAKPMYLESYFIPDSLKFKRIILWKHDSYLNRISGMLKQDTTADYNYHFLPFMKKDVGAEYLGVSGSAAQYRNFFNRERVEDFSPFTPYIMYSFTKESHPFYNVKSPHTELAYRGTLLAERAKEESNIHILTTQNLSPALNLTLLYDRWGGKGLLNKEATDNRTFSFTSNYVGKRYVMHGGYIFQSIKRDENGGIIDDRLVLDTLVEPREIPYNLKSASNRLKRNSFFLTHSYGFPIKFSKKDTSKLEEGTAAYIGHSFEYATYYKLYKDRIEEGDSTGRGYYGDKFFINPLESYDSLRLNKIENRVFLKIQPWSQDAIVSNLEGGLGHKYLSYFNYRPEFDSLGTKMERYNNTYAYFGASGMFRKYLKWDGLARIGLTGYEAGDIGVNANAKFSLYPIRQGIHLNARFRFENRSPEPLQRYMYSNHFKWDNSFGKTTETRIEADMEIPLFRLGATFGYSIIDNYIYYDRVSDIKQHNGLLNILAASLNYNFKLSNFHFHNRVLLQLTSDASVLPLPLLSANLRYFFQFNVVKNVMAMQLGADVTYHTKYYAPAYSPATGHFHVQDEREIGSVPYIDVFVNIQWKKAAIFVKYMNTAQGWPTGDYFSAHHYTAPRRAFQFGINWPFYIK